MNNVQLLTNARIRSLGLRAGRATVTDLRTNKRYDIFWGGPPQTHSDFSPMTPADTETMRQISNGWNWNARPVALRIGSFNLAAGVHHFPHGSVIGGNPGLPNMSNTRPVTGWPIGGHFCMYFQDSVPNSGDGNSQYARDMRAAAAEAYEMAGKDVTMDKLNFRIDGEEIQFDGTVINDRAFIMPNDLVPAMGGTLSWEAATGTRVIETARERQTITPRQAEEIANRLARQFRDNIFEELMKGNG